MRWLLVLALTLCAPVAGAADREIRLTGLPVWDSAPLLYLVDRQPLPGVRFTFRPWTTPEQLQAKLIHGEADLASAPVTLAALFGARGIVVHVLGSTSARGQLAIVSQVETPRSIAVPFRGGLPDLVLRRIRGGNGLRHTGSPVETLQLLLAGQVEAAFLAEPFVSLAMARQPGLRRVGATCDKWRQTTGLGHCPVIGTYLTGDLPPDLLIELEQHLAAAHQEMRSNSDLAAALLRAAFPEMADLPMDLGFGSMEQIWHPACADAPMRATLAELARIAPQLPTASLPRSAGCGE